MNLTDLLHEHNIPFRRFGESEHVSKPNWIAVDCVHCREHNRFHLGFNLTTGYASCWRCGYHKLTDALVLLTGLTAGELWNRLDGLGRFERAERRAAGKLVIPEGVGPLLPAHVRYLKGRGFDPGQLAKLWGVGGIGPGNAKLAWRLYIPIHQHGRQVSWTTRAVSGNARLRYISAPAKHEAISPKRLLYGADHARHAVIVCEGPADVWAIGPGAVATLGVGWSRAQARLLTEYPVRVVCFDSENSAQKRARNLSDYLAVWPGKTCNVVLDAPDPGSAPPKEIRALRKEFLEA